MLTQSQILGLTLYDHPDDHRDGHPYGHHDGHRDHHVVVHDHHKVVSKFFRIDLIHNAK